MSLTITTSKVPLTGIPGSIAIIESPQSCDVADNRAALDVSDIVVSSIQTENLKLRCKVPMTFGVSYDSDYGMWSVEAPALELSSNADSRDGLIAELHHDLAYLWKTFSRGDRSNMTPGAQKLATDLEALLEEVQ